MRQHVHVWFSSLVGLSLVVSYGCGRDRAEAISGITQLNGIVFVKRANFDPDAGQPVVQGGPGGVLDYQRYVPGGGVFVLSPPRPDGSLESLTSEFASADFQGIDLSADARSVVFAMKTSAHDHYHLYVARVAPEGNGSHGLRQLTFGEHDDVLPIFVPGGRIAFVTNQPYTAMGTRSDEYGHAADVTQIGTIDTVAGDADRRLCPQHLSHTVDLFLRSDGSLGFSRWEHLGDVDDVKLYRMNPDCTDVMALAGHHDKPFNSLVQASEYEPDVVVGIGTSRHGTLQAGALVKVDLRARAPSTAHSFDEEHPSFVNLTPAVPTSSAPSPSGRYRTPKRLADGRLLTAWAPGWINEQHQLEQSPANFGLYVFDPNTGKNTLVYDDPRFSELHPLALVPRNDPMPQGSGLTRSADPTQGAVIGSIDVTATSLDELVVGAQFSDTKLAEALKQATHVRVIEGFSTEIGSIPMFGFTPHEGAAILGEAPVLADGSFAAMIPPFVPVRLQAIDKFGMAIRSDTQWIQAMPGEKRTCGGCHEARTQVVSPRNGTATALAMEREPTSLMPPIGQRREYGWDSVVQPILDQKCLSCHGPDSALARRTYRVFATARGGQRRIHELPWLDLSNTPIFLATNQGYVALSRSYVSLYFPQQLRRTNGVRIEGPLPPDWMVPGNARQSKLIELLNPKAEDGTVAFAGRPEHDVQQGQPLTAEEKGVFVRSADLGGQFFSRQNAMNSACWRSEAADRGACGNGGGATTRAVSP